MRIETLSSLTNSTASLQLCISQTRSAGNLSSSLTQAHALSDWAKLLLTIFFRAAHLHALTSYAGQEFIHSPGFSGALWMRFLVSGSTVLHRNRFSELMTWLFQGLLWMMSIALWGWNLSFPVVSIRKDSVLSYFKDVFSSSFVKVHVITCFIFYLVNII